MRDLTYVHTFVVTIRGRRLLQGLRDHHHLSRLFVRSVDYAIPWRRTHSYASSITCY